MRAKIYLFLSQIVRGKGVSSKELKIEFSDVWFYLFFSGYDNSITCSSYWPKMIGKDLRKECTYIQLECDDKFFCDFEFSNEYNWVFSKGYGKIYE